MHRRILLAVAFTVFGLLLAEGILRLSYPELPSLAPLEESDLTLHTLPSSDPQPTSNGDSPSLSCGEETYLDMPDVPQAVRYGGNNDGEPLRIWFAGDSITAGAGIKAEQAFPALLGERLSVATGRPVLGLNLGVRGGGFCSVLRRLQERISDDGYPDLVVILFFADDLEDRRMVQTRAGTVAFPDRVPNPILRTTVSHSYFANLVWYAGRRWGVGDEQRFYDTRQQSQFSEAVPLVLHQLERGGTDVVVALLAPTGLHFCRPTLRRDSLCSSLGPAMDRIAELLEKLEVPFVDLRDLWVDKPTMVLSGELSFLRGRTGIHPNPEGHREISDALWPAIEQVTANWIRGLVL